MQHPLQILHLEDDANDAILIAEFVRSEFPTSSLTRVSDRAGFTRKIHEAKFDLILCDFNLHGYSGAEALAEFRRADAYTPFILVSGAIGEECAIDMLKQGATDYVLKTNLARLNSAIHRALEEAQTATARRRAEQHVYELNRLYRFLSESNQMIVRVRDRQQLFDEACRIAVEFGKFHSARVWEYNHVDHIVRVVAEFCPPDQTMRDQEFSMYDPLINASMLRSALERREVFYTNDYAGDEIDPILKDAARVRGIHASISLPVFCEERLIAAFSIYSSTSNFFDDEEISLLTELSNDLSFTLNSLQHEEHRNTAERALHESEERYRTLVENTKDFIYSFDAEGKFTAVNHAFCEAMQRPVEEIIGKEYHDLGFPDSSSNVWHEYHHRVLDSGERVSFETDAIMPGGETRHFTVVFNPIKNSDGTTVGIRGVSRDMTEFKRAQREMIKLQNAVERSSDVIFMTDCDGNILYANPSFERTYGHEMNVLLGKVTPRILKSGCASEEVYKDFWQSILRKENVHGEFINKTKNGGLITVDEWISPIVDEANSLIGFLAIQRDITQKKAAEEALRRNESLLIETGKIANIGGWELDVRTMKPLWSLQTYRIHEVDPSTEPDLESAINYYAPEARPIITQAVNRALEHGDSWDLELPFITATGRNIWVRAMGQAEMRDGKCVRLFGAFQDITERKQVERELIAAKERAELSDKLKDAFIANISHEIRTPLNIILGFSDLLASVYAGEATADVQQYFESIQSGSERLMRTVDHVLNYSRLQVGEYPMKVVRVNLLAIVEKLIREMKPIAREKMLSLNFINECDASVIEGDEFCITQTLANLMDNAIKYTPKGTVTIHLHTCDQDSVAIDVSDTGIGISEEYLQQLFHPYSQEDIGYSRMFEGIGLGLALVKKYIDLHHGTINVQSRKGIGTKFSIRWNKKFSSTPVSELPQPLDRPQAVVSAVNPKATRNMILLVEDDSMSQVYVRSILKGQYHLRMARSASEAWEIMRSEAIDLILMDISIDGKTNGLELAREIRASDGYAAIPIIALTAHAFPIDRENAFDAGCTDYLSKPVKPNVLLNMIEKYVG